MRKNRAMIAVIGVSVIVLVLIGFLVFQTYSFASTEFIDDGYVLTTVSENTPDDTVNAQHYFNKGTKFTKKYPEKVVFKNVDGDKVSLDTKNFLHYQSGSMSGLTKSVILDTDKLDAEQISYYSVSNKSMLEITGKDYQVSNGGEMVSFSNFVWKISDSQYMVVSDEVKLYVSENEQKVFDNYVELQYKDEGVVYLVNQEGTYSTVSSDAYLELNNGIQIFLGSKNISDGEVVLVNMAQMVIDSDDNIEIIPDEEYKNENLDTPTINIDVEDGEPGLDGDEGQQGEQGEAGTPGDPGETGENGNNGNNGNNGSNGVAGSPGTPGGPGKPGDPGNQGESADNSDVIFNPETMPQFDAVLTPTPYGVNANISYNNNSCLVSQAVISIVEKSSGAEVWRRNVTEELASSFSVKCDILKQNTEYAFVISATYTNDNTTDPITQDVYKKLFVTSDLGVKLEKKYSTQEAIVLNLTKTADSTISSVRVKYFDENMNLMGYGAPLGIEQGENSGIFDISSIQEGESVPVQFLGLEHNKVYYMQLEVTSLTDGSDVSIIPTNSFPVQKYMTLKIPPEIGKPKVTLSERTNSFTIEPSYVTDPDNGIMYYRYEIYEAGDIVANPDEEPDTPTEGEEQPGTVTTPVDNTNPSLDNMLSYMDNLNISTNEEGETVIEKKENSEEQSGDGTSAEGEADSMVNIMAEPEDEPSGDTAGEPSTGDQTGESSGEPPADVTDQTGDEDWLSSLTTEGKEELLQSFQQFDDEKKTVLTSLAPMAKGTAGTSYTIKGTPVYTAEKETAAKIDVPIDGTKIRRETDYVVRIIGVFYDNEGIIEYSSPLSDVFRAGASMWPSISNEMQDGYLTASTAEGIILVTDNTEVIDGEIWLEVASSTEINGAIIKTTIPCSLDDIKGNGYYEIPYALKALKSGQPYTISVFAERMNINGKVYTNVVVGNISFTTKTYSPLLVSEADTELSDWVGDSKSHSFVAKIALQPEDFDREAELRGKESDVDGLDNVGDVSAKSLTALFFELYKEKENGSGPEDKPFTLMGMTVGRAALKGVSAEGYDAQNYQFDSEFYQNGYMKSADDKISQYKILLNEEDFGLTTDDLADYDREYIYIKVSEAYDYTYGVGSNTLYGNNNIVPIGTQDGFAGDKSVNDRFVKVEVHPIIPPFPEKINNNNTTYNKISELLKRQAESKLNGGVVYDSTNSNISSDELDTLKASWSDLDESTGVGVVIQGPTSLAKYSQSVRYYIYDKYNNRVAESGDLTVDYVRDDPDKQEMPQWTYFLSNADDAEVKRGETFHIETKVVLKYIESEDRPGEKMVYPDETTIFNDRQIIDSFILDKDLPRFSIIPWAGDTSSEEEDMLYFTYKDVDKALIYENNSGTAENIGFYYMEEGKRKEFSSHTVNSATDIGGKTVPEGYYSLSVNLPADGTLAVDYLLKETDQSKSKDLFSEAKVIGKEEVSIFKDVECDVEEKTSDNNYMSFTFKVPFAASSSASLGRVDIDLWVSGDPNRNVSLKNVDFNILSDITDGNETYLAQFTVKSSRLYTLAGESEISYNVKLYYDDGKYGLKYASSDGSGPSYALQNRNGGNYVNTYFRDSLFTRSDFSLLAGVNRIKLEGYGTVYYDDYGMSCLPKSISCAEKKDRIELEYVVPDAQAEVLPGLTSARIDAVFSGDNTLKTDGSGRGPNAELRYRKVGAGEDVWITENITILNNLDDNGQHVEVLLDNLEPGTEYEFEILGYVNVDSEGNIIKKHIYDKNTFRTNPKIDITIAEDENENANVEFIAGLRDRSDKQARVKFTLEDIFKNDLESVESVTVSIRSTSEMDEETGEYLVVSTVDVPASTLKNWFDAQVSGGSVDPTQRLDLWCSVDLGWSPNTQHKMDGSTSYTAEAKVNYSSELVNTSPVFAKNFTPSPWETVPMFAIVGRASSTRDESHRDIYSIQFDISGNDLNRVITGNSNSSASLVLQLVKADTGEPVDDTLRKLDVQLSGSGIMMPANVSYSSKDVSIEANTTYKLKVYYNADYENEGLKAAGISGDQAVNYNRISEDVSVTTPKSAAASISEMLLLPAVDGEGKVRITGVNLNNTEIIKYTITDSTTGKIYPIVTYRNDDLDFGDKFSMEQSTSYNQYMLSVPELSDPTHNYTITVVFGEMDNGREVEVARSTATYEGQPTNGIVATISRIISGWIS